MKAIANVERKHTKNHINHINVNVCYCCCGFRYGKQIILKYARTTKKINKIKS